MGTPSVVSSYGAMVWKLHRHGLSDTKDSVIRNGTNQYSEFFNQAAAGDSIKPKEETKIALFVLLWDRDRERFTLHTKSLHLYLLPVTRPTRADTFPMVVPSKRSPHEIEYHFWGRGRRG